MRKLLLVGAAVGGMIAATTALAKTVGVDIAATGFRPAEVTVESGDSVSWKNSDTVQHDVVVQNTACKLTLQPAQSSSCTFTAPGTFAYSDPNRNEAGFRGKITVTPAVTRSVTLTSSRPHAIFGGAVVLSGTVSSKKAGDTVTVTARPAGEPERRIEVKTTGQGNWSLRVQPRIRTEYQAAFESALSPKVSVNVRPRITFQKVGAHRFLVVVLAAHSMAGKSVDMARWVPGRGWVVFQSFALNSIARTETIAVRTVTTLVRRGTKLRIFMPSGQAAPNYMAGHSNFVVK